jgi:hypothetical protein
MDDVSGAGPVDHGFVREGRCALQTGGGQDNRKRTHQEEASSRLEEEAFVAGKASPPLELGAFGEK